MQRDIRGAVSAREDVQLDSADSQSARYQAIAAVHAINSFRQATRALSLCARLRACPDVPVAVPAVP
jgi:hypothetical protein